MTSVPTDDEAAAIVAALLQHEVREPPSRASRAPSRWGEAARREGVTAQVPATWRG